MIAAMPTDHPFQQLFENFGKLPEAHSESVNRGAREEIKGWLGVPLEKPGHCILLKAPRAGHGKTHLLTRLQHELGGTHEFIPVHAISGSRIDAATVLDDTLRRLVRGLPAAGGLTVLDLVTRRLFSSSLQPLVRSGEVPCQDREGALTALRSRPIETFDFHHPSAVTAHWARENFELLGPRLALELSQRNGLSLREVSFWVDAMFRFAATPIDNPGRVRALAAVVFDSPTAEAAAHERLVALLGLLSSLLRVVLVADELEGFSSDETAALRFASFLGSLRQSVERADVILSVNQDVWESAFLPRLSGGLADRLSEITVELEPLDREGMIAVIESRSPGMGEKILKGIGTGATATHARGIIKEAAQAWDRDSTPEPAEKPAFGAADAPQEIPAFSPPPSETTAPKMDEPKPPAADVPVIPKPPEPAPADAPTRFSPEAAIAAFKASPAAFESPVDSEPTPTVSALESQWPSPDASPPSEPAYSKFASPAPAEPSAPVTVEPVAEPPAPAFSLPPEPEPEPFASSTSAFQPAPEPEPEPEPEPFAAAPTAFQPAPEPAPVAPETESPFQIDEAAVQAFQAPAEPEPPAPAPPAESPVEPSTDRVDDLLRQFRERYGKS